jgi:hypothetical protein
MNIALLGAPATGKTQLARALQRHFQDVHVVLDAPDPDLVTAHPAEYIVLVCGMDLIDPRSSTTNQWPSDREHTDKQLRQQLQDANMAFQVVYGSGDARLKNALFCIARHDTLGQQSLSRPELIPSWQGPCERCADADCEHRLFTSLMSGGKINP